jgi:hypothetical protein
MTERQASVVGKTIKKAAFSSGSVRLELDDGTVIWVLSSGPLDGRGEFNFHHEIQLPGEKPW